PTSANTPTRCTPGSPTSTPTSCPTCTCGATCTIGKKNCPAAASGACAAPSTSTTCGYANGRTYTSSCGESRVPSAPPSTASRPTPSRSTPHCCPACCPTWA